MGGCHNIENLQENFLEHPGPENQKSPRRISAGGRKDLIRFLTNENRAQGSKDLTKQQGLPSKYFFNNNNKNNNNSISGGGISNFPAQLLTIRIVLKY